MRHFLFALIALLGTGCVSFAEAPRLPSEVARRILGAPSPHFRAHVECEPSGTACGDTSRETLVEVKKLLSTSAWFDSVEADRAEANLLISVEPLEPTPYTHSPAHYPGALLLALVIPIPWMVNSGYRLTAVVPASGAAVEVDTRRESRAVFWSLAALLNLFSPDRAFFPRSERELAQIHAQLLPLIDSGP